jgi:hypothetical protein
VAALLPPTVKATGAPTVLVSAIFCELMVLDNPPSVAAAMLALPSKSSVPVL